MFVGAYWSAREESREAAAARIAEFLAALGAYSEDFAIWCGGGRSKAAALRNRLALDASSIAKTLKVNRDEIDRQPIPDLGFSYGGWNGKNASFGVTIGCWCEFVSNNVTLDVSKDGGRSAEWYRPILEEMVRVFDPDHAVITTHETLARPDLTEPWEEGLITYERGKGFQ